MQQSDVDVIWEGANVVLLQQVAGGLLKDLHRHIKSSAGSGIPGSLPMLFEHAMMEIRDKNLVQRLRSDEQHLNDIQMYMNALQ